MIPAAVILLWSVAWVLRGLVVVVVVVVCASSAVEIEELRCEGWHDDSGADARALGAARAGSASWGWQQELLPRAVPDLVSCVTAILLPMRPHDTPCLRACMRACRCSLVMPQ